MQNKPMGEETAWRYLVRCLSRLGGDRDSLPAEQQLLNSILLFFPRIKAYVQTPGGLGKGRLREVIGNERVQENEVKTGCDGNKAKCDSKSLVVQHSFNTLAIFDVESKNFFGAEHLNAFTSAFKKLDPVPQFKATAKLGGFLAQLPN